MGSYIHAGGKIGVLVEVNCESDFVARTDDFKELLHDIAMHIAASDPNTSAKKMSRLRISPARRTFSWRRRLPAASRPTSPKRW